jgi:hypothetical protein
MLRLELEAQLANAEAETAALTADAAVEEGRPLADAAGAAPTEESAAAAVPVEDEAPPA